MGRLSEYVNGYRGSRPTYLNSGSRSRGGGGLVEVYGVDADLEAFGRILTSDPQMKGLTRSLVTKILREARNNLSKDAKNYLKDDPRKAFRAVKYAVYKTAIGGNLSILQKKKGKAGARFQLVRTRKVDQNPDMRGGNRRPRVEGRNRLDTYFGSDRGFILRFIGSGTVDRNTRFGNRGSIRRTNWFGRTAPWQMEAAAERLSDAINEYVKTQING